MIDELLSLRVVNVSESQRDHDLLRQAASISHVPIELVEADGAPTACRLLAGATDLVFIDGALADDGINQVTAAARAAPNPAFTVLLSDTPAAPFPTDGLAAKPARLDEAKRLMNGAARVKLPSRVLIVDDSSTMRTIVRKILKASRFPFEVTEVQQGIEAINLAREVAFDIIFLDYNMPGLSGLETMSEFRREKHDAIFVLMTSAQGDTIADRALAQGAFFLKKPFFPADIESMLCGFYGLHALNPQRA